MKDVEAHDIFAVFDMWSAYHDTQNPAFLIWLAFMEARPVLRSCELDTMSEARFLVVNEPKKN